MNRKVRLDPRVLGSRVFMALWLTFAWVLLWGPVEVGTIAGGLLAAVAGRGVPPLPPGPLRGPPPPGSPPWPGVGGAHSPLPPPPPPAGLSIRPAAPPRSAVLRAPMKLKSDFTLALAVNTLNLMPGGIVVRVDPVARYVYVHVLDAASDRSVEHFRRQTAHIERLYLRAFERPEDWKPSPEHFSVPADTGPTMDRTSDKEETR